MKFKQKCIKSIPLTIHKKSSTNDLTVKKIGNGEDSLVGGALGYTTYFEEKSIVAGSMDDIVQSTIEIIDGSCMGTTTMDALDGKGGGD
jgi:hypothetical protein